MSVTAMLAYDYYFLPPVRSWNVAASHNRIVLGAFLVTALIGSHLLARMRLKAKGAERRRQEMERLYRFSQKLLSANNCQELLRTLPEHLVDCFEFRAVSLFVFETSEILSAGLEPTNSGESLAREIPPAEEGLRPEKGHDKCFLPLRTGTRRTGSLRLSGVRVSRSTLDAIAALTGVAIDRARAVVPAANLEGVAS